MPPELFREADIEGRSLTTYLAINRIQELVATQPEQEGPQERVRRYLIPILKRVYAICAVIWLKNYCDMHYSYRQSLGHIKERIGQDTADNKRLWVIQY